MDKVYTVGSTGPVVKALQNALNSKNSAGLKVTGKFDKETFEAFKAYQRRQGLNGTGEFTKADRVWRLLSPVEEAETQPFEVESLPLEVVPQPSAKTPRTKKKEKPDVINK